MPDLTFEVLSAAMTPYAAVPTLQFRLAVQNSVPGEHIRSVMLKAQVRIQAPQRAYDAETKARLRELFGEPGRWKTTLKSLLWTNATVNIPAFTDSAECDLPVSCTYDFEVVGAKYLYALADGDVPLEFLFSGTVLYSQGNSGIQASQIPWEKEASFRMPIRVWQETMDHYFPNSAWLRIRKDVYERLAEFKAREALLTWESVFERLLETESR